MFLLKNQNLFFQQTCFLNNSMITINGSSGEGGGQILRTALALSAITRKSFKIKNLRANRPENGLRPQHLCCILACKEICNAKISGAEIGSKTLSFVPGKITSKKYNFEFDIGTAGSAPLLLQTIIPILAFAPAPSKVEILGGTDIPFSPTIHYIRHVFCDFLQRIGLDTHLHILRHGFYPKGQGRIKIIIYPWKNKYPLNLPTQGKLKRIDTVSIASLDLKKRDVAHRQTYGFSEEIKITGDSTNQYVPSASLGTSFHAHAHFENTKLGSCEVGRKNISAEQVGRTAGLKLLKEMKTPATIDKRMADQMLLYLAFCGGEFRISKKTGHFKTNKKIIEKFLNCKISKKNNLIKIKPAKS